MVSIICFDFAYIPPLQELEHLREPEIPDQAQAGVPEEGGLDGGSVLGNGVSSWTPSQIQELGEPHIAHELLAFTQLLGHEKVTYYGDNKPTARRVLKLLVQARTSIGLETHMRTTKLFGGLCILVLVLLLTAAVYMLWESLREVEEDLKELIGADAKARV